MLQKKVDEISFVCVMRRQERKNTWTKTRPLRLEIHHHSVEIERKSTGG